MLKSGIFWYVGYVEDIREKLVIGMRTCTELIVHQRCLVECRGARKFSRLLKICEEDDRLLRNA